MKKVLIVTYYWPPAGGPGVQRILKFVKYLPDFGWQPVILTVENPSSPAYDKSLLVEDGHFKIYKTKSLEPFSAYRSFTGKKPGALIPKDVIAKKAQSSIKENFARWIRANLFVPDARLGWLPYLKKEGMRIIAKEKPDIIFSTSPPHSLQIGARKLAKKSKLKWICDLRDPWSEAYWETDIGKNVLARKINAYFEKKTLQSADAITTVSQGLIDIFQKKSENNYYEIHNGYEQLNTNISKTERFNIVFIGNLSKYQNPDPFIQAFKKLPGRIKKETDVYFVGKVFDDFRKVLQNEGFFLKDYMPYDELMNFSKSASMFLLILHQTSYHQGYITAKIFDYLALRKPVVALGNKNGIADKVIQDTSSGKLFEKNEITDIADYISKTCLKWQNNKSILLEGNEALIKYSTQYNVKKLAEIMESVL